jgi:signal recognition particle subunit SEC65
VYPTYEEAQQAVRMLGINFQTEYLKQQRHKEDPRLPGHPQEYYKDKGWVNWPEFFGRKRPEYYPTYEEAQQAVRILGIKNATEYVKQKRFKEDPRLPSNPHRYYKDKGWVDWPEFLVKQEFLDITKQTAGE